MATTGLGEAINLLRTNRDISLREVSQLTSIDHAYVHRLEKGEKTNPSSDLIEKLIKVFKPNKRDAEILRWLATHADTNPELVKYVFDDPAVSLDEFVAAAGVRHRGASRPDPATLISRVKLLFDDD